jgi:cell division protein FtsZ
MADEVLHSGVRGVTDLMIMPGLINLDFADIRTVMGEMGKAMMGTGEGEGPKRAIDAAEAAISNPLLDEVSMKGARGVLINITGSYDMTLFEADEAASRIREEVDPNANIIFGATFNQSLEGKIRVSVVATGIDSAAAAAESPSKPQAKAPDPNRFYGGKLGFVAPPRPPEPVRFPSAAAAPGAVESEVAKASQSQPAAMGHKAVVKDGNSVTHGPAFPSPAPQLKVVPVANANDTDDNTLVAFVSNLATAIGALKYQEEAQQMPLPMAVGMRAGFVSPRAAQPAQRSFFAATDDVEYTGRPVARGGKARSNLPDNVKEREVNGNGALNFLHRMANVGRVLAAKQERPERMVHVVEKTKEALPVPQGQSDNDYLEIPAFLRRQAN